MSDVRRMLTFAKRVAVRAILPGAAVLILATSAGRAQQSPNEQADSLFADVAKSGSPGCALGVFRDGKIVYQKGYGLANVENNVPITPETVFDVGSTSKQITAASIVLLEEQGKLSLNDDIRKYFPELPDYGHIITIAEILHHTSGLRDYIALIGLSGNSTDNVTTSDDAIASIVRQKGLNFEPGTEWLYSNTGYFLASEIVRRVSGKSLREFADENIFQPLGMTHTVIRDDHTLLMPNRALAYRPKEGGGYALDVSYLEVVGGGSMHTTIGDLARWDENFYNGKVGGQRLGTELTQRGALNDGKPLDYALGLMVEDFRGLRMINHAGAWGGYRAELIRFPEAHFSVACLCNLGTAGAVQRARAVAEVYLGGQMKPKASKASGHGAVAAESVGLPAADQLQSYVGIYRLAPSGVIFRVQVSGGKIYLVALGVPIELRAVSANEFETIGPVVEAHVTFTPASNGTPQKLSVQSLHIGTATYEQVSPLTLTPWDLAAYAGNYWSDELEAKCKLTVEEGKLILHTKGFPPIPLEATAPDEFEIGEMSDVFQFRRSADRKITSFILNSLRERGFIYERSEQQHAN